MNNFIKKITRILCVGAFSCLAFFACQKADIAPYGNPSSGIPSTINPPTFRAEVNSSPSLTSFTPIKTIHGGYVILEGVSTYYTITISLPVSEGPGNYSFAFTPNIRATITNGGITYVADANVFSNGSITISSINQGKYNATFSFSASDSTDIDNSINVSRGTLQNM